MQAFHPNWTFFLLYLTALEVVRSFEDIRTCPGTCTCMGQTIACKRAELTTVPKLGNIVPGKNGGALQYLSISHNPIIRLENASFEGLADLIRLELSSDQLVLIGKEAFIGLPSLQSLSLKRNRIAYLDSDIFTPVSLLETLDLSYNQLTSIPFSLEGLIYLKELSLTGNPLNCPCELVDFSLSLFYLEQPNSHVTCNGPPEVAQMQLIDLGKELRTVTGNTKLLGYQTAENTDRDEVIRSLPYVPSEYSLRHSWPWPHCAVEDFGSQSTEVSSSQDHDAETLEPKFIDAPQNVEVVVGEVARFICRAQGNGDWRISWILPVNATNHIRLYRRRQILEIDEVHSYHQGTYTCVIFTKNGQRISSDASLTLLEPAKPRITYAPPANDNAVEENVDLELRCSSYGRPKPKIAWLWQEERLPRPLVTGGRYIVRSFTSGVGSPVVDALPIYATNEYILASNQASETTSYLLIKNFTQSDTRGRYICYASNRFGTARVSSILHIKTKRQQTIPDIDISERQEASDINLSGETLVKRVIEKARQRIETAIKKTADRLRNPNRHRTSADINALFRQPSQAALELAKAAEVYEAAIDEVTSILRQDGELKLNDTISSGEILPDVGPGTRLREVSGVKITSDQLAIISQLSGCQQPSTLETCTQHLCFHLEYRSVDGACNNFNHPRWGAALEPLKRLLPPQYENGINSPIGWNSDKLYFGFPKPSARLVSRELMGNITLMKQHELRLQRWNELVKIDQTQSNNTKITTDYGDRKRIFEQASNKYKEYEERIGELFNEDDLNSGMLMQWGQFLDHDLDFTPVDASISRYSDGLNCNETCTNDPPCFPIIVPPGDSRIKHRCIGFSRSSATCGSGSTSILVGKPHHREQLNQITSYIDASNVYGSEELENSRLRETLQDEGKLWTGIPTASGKRLLPFTISGQVDCQIEPGKEFVPCFRAGDHRNNENLGLLALHTLWMREHNRLADGLRTLNPDWPGDRIYQEARKIVGACMQAVTYKEWLPQILGPEGMKLLGTYTGYDDQVDASISNEFATAAMRFGHTMIPPIVYRLDSDWNAIKEGHLLLHRAFFAPDRLLKDGGMDPYIRGLLFNGIRDSTKNPPLNPELTERLFALAHELALDLASLNIQRGRDHGIPGYIEYAFRFCKDQPNASLPEAFQELRSIMPDEHTIETLRKVYGHPGNIDLFAGGVLEINMRLARVGPTFACIIADQFKRLRSGDRFWYEAEGVFTAAQLAEIKRAGGSLSRVICENADNITQTPLNAFLRPLKPADLVSCSNVPKLNLAAWVECTPTYKVASPSDVLRVRNRRSVEKEVCDKSSCPAVNKKQERAIERLEQRTSILEKLLYPK